MTLELKKGYFVHGVFPSTIFDYILLETGDYLLLESGDKVIV